MTQPRMQRDLNKKRNTVIESLGVYLPPHSFSTSEVLQACTNPIRFPLEKITGIKTRPMAGKEEFAIDLAREALADCLAHSQYGPEDIDLLICCNISRVDGPDFLSFEPSTSVRLKKHFGCSKALAFDITNACAGMFTGIYIADAFLKSGAIRRGLVVSGEYITHLTHTAQREIENYMDSRIACLTLGDAGAALLLENGKDDQAGFQKIDLQTFGRYSPYCIAKEAASGGWIMYTDSVNLTDVALKTGVKYALDQLQEAGWRPDAFQHLIMHQTSRLTLNSAKREINNLLKDQVFHEGNTVDNLELRGNTASTSHFVALADQIRNNRIQSGDKVVFSVSASGLTVGAGLYVLDDLPDRLQRPNEFRKPSYETTALQIPALARNIRIESVGTARKGTDENKDSLELLRRAANHCLDRSAYPCNDIGLLIHTGVYREEYLMEPAYAALLAGKLDMNASLTNPENKKTLAFDVFNGALGFLNACHIARQMIALDYCEAAMIVASEHENNAGLFPDKLMGLRETASAIILDAHPVENKGFSHILFNYDLSSLDAYTAHCYIRDSKSCLQVDKNHDLEDKYLACIAPLVRELLQQEGLEPHQIDRVFPPQISSGFIARLAGHLGLPLEKFVDAVGEGPDLFSSSLPHGIEHAREKQWIKAGDIGLLIAVGSGIQAGCAIYRF